MQRGGKMRAHFFGGLKSALRVCVLTFTVAFSQMNQSEARVYSWVPVHRNDIKVIVSPQIEAELRLEMIRRASKTIDIVTYDQRADNQIGLPLLQEIKKAADRGV